MSTMAPERLVGTDTDQLTLFDLDFDHTPVCDIAAMREIPQFAGPKCPDRPAAWLAIRGCCGARQLLCTPCKEEYLEYHQHSTNFVCSLCGTDSWGYAYVEELRS